MSQADNLAALGTNVNSSGVLQPAGGGTGATTFPSPGTAGNVLTSNGSVWTSVAAAAFDAGTRMMFVQTSAPTGWTKDTTNYNNHAIRVVTGTASTGGSVAFTTAFASQTPSGTVSVGVSAGTLAVSVGTLSTNNTTAGGSVSVASNGSVSAYTLSTSEIPGHTHTITGIYNNNVSDQSQLGIFTFNNGVIRTTTSPSGANSTGGGGSHSHGFTNPSYNFSGTAHNHTISGSPSLSGSPSITSSTFSGNAINLAVQYLDVITATKN
jgi:hypothetical protein